MHLNEPKTPSQCIHEAKCLSEDGGPWSPVSGWCAVFVKWYICIMPPLTAQKDFHSYVMVEAVLTECLSKLWGNVRQAWVEPWFRSREEIPQSVGDVDETNSCETLSHSLNTEWDYYTLDGHGTKYVDTWTLHLNALYGKQICFFSKWVLSIASLCLHPFTSTKPTLLWHLW